MLKLRTAVSGFDRLFKLNIERLSDISEPLKATGKDIQQESQATFAAERSRSGAAWAPLAKSTTNRLEHTTTSPVTIKGVVRRKYQEQVATYLKRQQKAGKYNELVAQEFKRLVQGGSPTAAADPSVAGSFKRLRRELGKTVEQRRNGPRQSKKHKVLGKIFSMIRMKVIGESRHSRAGLSVGILGNSRLAVQNEGGT